MRSPYGAMPSGSLTKDVLRHVPVRRQRSHRSLYASLAWLGAAKYVMNVVSAFCTQGKQGKLIHKERPEYT